MTMRDLIPWSRNTGGSGSDSQLAPISRMRMDWDRMFDRILDDVWSPAAGSVRGLPLDILETSDEIRVMAEVPGMKPDQLDISLTGDVLTLAGEKRSVIEPKEGERLYTERTYGSFQRAIKLPCAVDVDSIDAEYHDGLVTIALRKSDADRPKRIEIRAK